MKYTSQVSSIFNKAMPDWKAKNIIRLNTESVNDNYRITARSKSGTVEQQFFIKLISDTKRVAPSFEPFIHKLLDGKVRHIIPMTSAGEESRQRYFITEYIPDTIELLNALTEDSLTVYWANWSEQIVTFIEECSALTFLSGYGFINQDTHTGVLTDWQLFLDKNLEEVGFKINEIIVKHGEEYAPYLNKIHRQMIQAVADKSDYWNSVKRALVPIDLNLKNFLVHDSQLFAIDLEAFVIGDPLLAYGEFMGHTYKTPFAETFSKAHIVWTPEQNKLIHFYALLSNLNIFCFIASGIDKGVDLNCLKPWGNSHSFITLMQEHFQISFGEPLPGIRDFH